MKSQKNKHINKIYHGDATAVMKELPARCIDLIITSPPYADRRKKQYGGPPPDKYVEWFLPFAEEFHRILKPRGSLVLNIKENADRGERHTYVLELVLAMRKKGWFWIEDYIWHKKNAFPGKWPNRFRDAWEHCLHFTKQRDFRMYQDAVKVPIGDWADKRLKNLGKNDRIRNMSRTDSGLGRQLTNWIGKRKVYPTNVLHLPTISANRNHCAVYPEALPTWFIKLFTKRGDAILDPFIGSGTTAVAAIKTERSFIGIDLSKKYCGISKRAIKNTLSTLNKDRGETNLV
jgi:DNA modification methylase